MHARSETFRVMGMDIHHGQHEKVKLTRWAIHYYSALHSPLYSILNTTLPCCHGQHAGSASGRSTLCNLPGCHQSPATSSFGTRPNVATYIHNCCIHRIALQLAA